jgi:hypothetical protein
MIFKIKGDYFSKQHQHVDQCNEDILFSARQLLLLKTKQQTTSHHFTYSTSQRFTLPKTYLCRKNERALSGNLQNQTFSVIFQP